MSVFVSGRVNDVFLVQVCSQDKVIRISKTVTTIWLINSFAFGVVFVLSRLLNLFLVFDFLRS